MLEIKEIVTGYGDMKVLDGVSLHVDSGEAVSLVGSILGLVQPDSLPGEGLDLAGLEDRLPRVHPYRLAAFEGDIAGPARCPRTGRPRNRS